MVVRVAVARSRVRDRNALFAALSEAVRPDSAASVLVVVGFEGMKEYLRESSEPEADHLLSRLGERLVESIGEGGVVFASRRGEFCALCEGGLAAIRSLLVMLPSDLDEIGRAAGIKSSLGIAVLPDEATIPTYALALADRRIRALSGDIRGKVK